MYYVITRNGKLLGVWLYNVYNQQLNDVSIHEMDGPIPDLNCNEWDSDTDSFKWKEAGNVVTKLQFLDKFSINERIAISSSADPVVVDIMRMFDAADYINMKDPKTMQAMQYFMYTNYISQDRYLELMA